MPDANEVRETLWQIYSRYTESEIDAVDSRDIDQLDVLARRKELIKKAVSGDAALALQVVWERVAEIAQEIITISAEGSGKKFAQALVELGHYSEILSEVEGAPPPDEVRDFVSRGTAVPKPSIQQPHRAPAPASLPSPSVRPAEPAPTATPAKAPKAPVSPTKGRPGPGHVAGKTSLDEIDRKALTLLAYGNHSTFQAVAEEIWAETSRPVANLIWAKKRAIAFLELVWDNAESIEDSNDRELVKQLKASFQTLDSVKHRISRWKEKKEPAKQRGRQPKVADSSSPTQPQLTEEQRIAQLQGRTALAGFMSPDHAKLITAAILHGDGPTLNIPTLAVRTGFARGALEPLIKGAFKGLQAVLEAYDTKKPLADDALVIAIEIRTKYPSESAEDILRKIDRR